MDKSRDLIDNDANKESESSPHTAETKLRSQKKKMSNKKKKSIEKHEEEKSEYLVNGEAATEHQNLQEKLPNLLPKVEEYMRSLSLKSSKYQFWSTQPVPSIDEIVPETINEAISPNKDIDEIQSTPYRLPEGFHWDVLDLYSNEDLEDLYVLLNANYVEDDDNMFRFDYSKEFLQWALMPPGWRKEWHVGVKITKTNRLIGFISAVPAKIRIYQVSKEMVEINFLCVHKKLRSKRLAPVLIKEITRRVNKTGIFQAVYTAGVLLPQPVASCRYWHRSLNPKKLIEVKFSHLGKNMTMQRTMRLYKLPEKTHTPGFQRMLKEHIDECLKLLETYLSKFDLAPIFAAEEFEHWFLPKKNIIDSYIVVKNNKITDFVSYYTLPSTVVNHPTYKFIKAAYSFYNISTETPWKVLMKDALISAKNDDFDVFNALDLMENAVFLEELKFGKGDGNLQYYLYNWKCHRMVSDKFLHTSVLTSDVSV